MKVIDKQYEVTKTFTKWDETCILLSNVSNILESKLQYIIMRHVLPLILLEQSSPMFVHCGLHTIHTDLKM